MDPGEDLPVMVNCLLNPDKPIQTLYLSYVKGKSKKEYLPIPDAKVYISFVYNSTIPGIIEFHHVGGEEWETREDPFAKVHPSGEYCLTVEIPGREVIKATTTIPHKYSPHLFPSFSLGDTFDYLMPGVALEHGNKQIKTSPCWVFASKGKHFKDDPSLEHYSFLATDHPYADDFNINGLRLSDLEIQEEKTGKYELAWRAFNNMQRLMPDLPLHEDFIRIDHLDTNYFHLLAGPLAFTGIPFYDHYDFLFVSEEYDKYLRDVYTSNSKLESDFTMIYSTNNHYSNISGGIGIFGSVISHDINLLDFI